MQNMKEKQISEKIIEQFPLGVGFILGEYLINVNINYITNISIQTYN